MYVDDYYTTAYKNLRFVHRKLTFADNKLASSDLHPMKQSNTFETIAWLERVVIVGIQKAPTKIDLNVAGEK